MKKGLTEIVYILDRSGSMTGLEEDTIGGFNSMIKKQKKSNKEALVTTILFDNNFEVLHDRINIKDVPEMTIDDYYTSGCTALLDSVGIAIDQISKVQKTYKKEKRPEKTVFIINTDGLENASHIYTYDIVKKMIHKKQKKGWEFLFIGANFDAAKEADKIGIKKNRATTYVHDDIGTKNVYSGMAKAVCSVMEASSLEEVDACIEDSGWSEEIEADYKKRHA